MDSKESDIEPVGYNILKDASLNKGTAFTMAEHENLQTRNGEIYRVRFLCWI